MKKVLLLFALLIFFAFLSFGANAQIKNNLNFTGDVQIFYANEIKSAYGSSIKNGKGTIIFSSIKNLKKIIHMYPNFAGFTLILNKYGHSFDCVLNKLNLKNLFYKQNKSIYGFSLVMPKSIFINNKKINTQITELKSNIYIGCPIILGSY
ncbi:MAG: hypothetical protein RR140_00480 [Clostridia bacterium]